MNNQAAQVGEIFHEASIAFRKLSEMTFLLHPSGEAEKAGGKWTDIEIDMLQSCVHRFAVDLNELSTHIKGRTDSQIHASMKKKAFEDAGMRGEVSSSVKSTPQAASQEHQSPLSGFNQGVLGKNAEVTLNMLNATENEVDVEGLGNDVKLEFEAIGEEVAT